jgi:hypothetical protein
MSWQSGSDIGIQIQVVARDGIRLEIARLPLVAVDDYAFRLIAVEPTEESRRRWLQAVSPPPPRVDGRPWYEAFKRDDRALPDWLQSASAADPYAGLPRLARPPLESIVLDQQVELAEERGRRLEFAREEPGNALGFAANEYPQPEDPVEVNAYIQCQLAWKHTLQPGAWIALSFDRFDSNALSTAFFAKVTDDWLFARPETVYPKASADG